MGGRAAAREPRGRVLRARARGEPGRRQGSRGARHRRAGARRRNRARLESRGRRARPQGVGREHALGDARAAEDRPHRLSVADCALRRSDCGVPLRSDERGARRGEGARCDALRRPGRPFHARRRALQLRRVPQALPPGGSGASPTRDHCARRGHGAAGPRAAGERACRDLAWPLAQVRRRPRDAKGRHGDVRRALRLVQGRTGRSPHLEPGRLPLEETAMNEKNRRLLEVIGTFFKIGCVGFGAPAVWGLIQAEVQERRTWLTKERYLEGLALVQTLPGAPAVQMCIFAGHQRAGWWGGLLGGLAFTLPAFAIMLALTALYSSYGALPLLRDALYGISPVVLGIFVAATYRLGRNAIKDLASVAVALIAAAAVSWVGVAGTLVLAGCAGVAMYHSRRAGLLAALATVILIAAERIAEPLLAGLGGTGSSGTSRELWDVGAFFLKVGGGTFGGGLSILAFIQDQGVSQDHWITPQALLHGPP